MMKCVHRQLSVDDGLLNRPGQEDQVVDINGDPKTLAAELTKHRSEELGRQPWGRGQAEWHDDALVLHSFPHEPHDLAVLPAQEEVMKKVADVDLRHVVVATEHLSHRVQASAS